MKKITPIQDKSIESLNNFNNNFLEVVLNIYTVKINNSYKYELKRHINLIYEYIKYEKDFIYESEFYFNLIWIFCSFFLWGGCFIIIIYYIKFGKISSISDCIFIFTLFDNIKISIFNMGEFINDFIDNYNKYKNIYNFIKAKFNSNKTEHRKI